MRLFRRDQTSSTVTCEDVVAAYAGVLTRQSKSLPFEPELIKGALVYTAAKSESDTAVAAAKNAFVALNSYVGKLHKTDISKLAAVSDDDLHGRLDAELDALELEFERRFAVVRSLVIGTATGEVAE